MDTSGSGAFLCCCTHDRVTEKNLQAGKEKILTESLLRLSQQTHAGIIKTYHIPHLPCCIYIEAPEIAKIQELMPFSAYGSLVSRVSRVWNDIDRGFLYGTRAPDVPDVGSWVRILQPGIYQGDLAVVFSKPSTGDIVTIAVVLRLWNKKRKGKGKGNARPAPALLDPILLEKFYPRNKENIHHIDSREFSSNGLEFLRVASAHALKIEPCPLETELLPFQSSLFMFDKRYQLDAVLHFALHKAFSNHSRRLWRMGDRVQILGGGLQRHVVQDP